MEDDRNDRDTLTGSIWEDISSLIDWDSWGKFGLPVPVDLHLFEPSISEENNLTITTMESQETTAFEVITSDTENDRTLIQETELNLESVNDFASLNNYCSQIENSLEQSRQMVISEVQEKYAREDDDAIDVFKKRMLAIAPYLTWFKLECLNDITVEFADHSYEIYKANCDRSFYMHFVDSFGITIEESEVGVYTVRGFEKKDAEDASGDYELVTTDDFINFSYVSKPQSVYLNINKLIQTMVETSEKDQEIPSYSQVPLSPGTRIIN